MRTFIPPPSVIAVVPAWSALALGTEEVLPQQTVHPRVELVGQLLVGGLVLFELVGEGTQVLDEGGLGCSFERGHLVLQTREVEVSNDDAELLLDCLEGQLHRPAEGQEALCAVLDDGNQNRRRPVAIVNVKFTG